MKKIKVLKDIPTKDGCIQAGTILDESVVYGFYCYEKEGIVYNCEILGHLIRSNPDFFEEIKEFILENGVEYYYIDSNLEVLKRCFVHISTSDIKRRSCYNYFETLSQAQEAADKVGELLFSIHENEDI